MITSVEWTRVESENDLPKKEGDYLVILDWGYRVLLHFSEKYRLFNTHASQDRESVERTKVTNVKWWGEVVFPEGEEPIV